MTNKVFVSKSGMFTFGDCPRHYKYAHLLHFKSDNPNDTMSVALSEGIRYHELFSKAFDFTDPPDSDKLFEQMFPGQDRDDNILQTFVAREKDRLETAKFWRPVATEMWIEDKTTRIRGAIDRVDQTNNGEYIVLDYKPKSYESRIEIAVYAKLLMTQGIIPKYGAIYGYRTSKMACWKILDKDYEDMQFMVDKVFEAIKNNDFPKNERNCFWCDYKLRCLEEDLSEEVVL